MSGRTRHAIQVEEEESYFASMTDVVIGLLFIFIIMLMFFATRFQQATQRQDVATQEQKQVTERQEQLIGELTNAKEARGEVLQSLGELLQKDGINVTIIRDEGILRFPEKILFEKASWDLNEEGVIALKSLAKALDLVLPCYTKGLRSKAEGCPKSSKAKIEAIFIEGHADADPYHNVANVVRVALPQAKQLPKPTENRPSSPLSLLTGSGQAQASQPRNQPSLQLANPDQRKPAAPPQDNLDLSALRATSAFRELLKLLQGLSDYRSPDGKSVLSVSGYGEYRPVSREEGETADKYKERNRRIDLRILMAASTAEDARKRQRLLQSP
jgi:flagellar motor protein MotB